MVVLWWRRGRRDASKPQQLEELRNLGNASRGRRTRVVKALELEQGSTSVEKRKVQAQDGSLGRWIVSFFTSVRDEKVVVKFKKGRNSVGAKKKFISLYGGQFSKTRRRRIRPRGTCAPNLCTVHNAGTLPAGWNPNIDVTTKEALISTLSRSPQHHHRSFNSQIEQFRFLIQPKKKILPDYLPTSR